MKPLTKEEAVDEHRRMWKWIAEETVEREELVCKEEYLKIYFPDDDIEFNCFCCEYGIQNGFEQCSHCPIDWDSKCSRWQCLNYYRSDSEGLFSLWERECDWEEAAKLAKRIAELPERQV